MTSKKIIIAIDGYSSSGKSSMAKQLAQTIGYAYIDSGAMYRAVTLYALRHGMIDSTNKVDTDKLVASLPNIDITFAVDNDGKSRTLLNGEDVEDEIRTLNVSNAVSPVAVIAQVRHELVDKQRSYGLKKGIVMDGRDIGTTVFPNAEMKIFVDASPEIRAKRRYKELCDKGQSVNFDDVYKNVCERDYIDKNRAESPLRCADDALILNNDDMSIEEQNQWLLNIFNKLSTQD